MMWSLAAVLQRRNPTARQQGFLHQIHLDVQLLVGLIVMTGFSLVVLYSASGQEMGLVVGQIIRLLLAFTVMTVMAQIPPQHYTFWSPWLYLIGLLLLLAVLGIGSIGGGAQRWLGYGSVRFQPSEIMKLAVPMLVAWFLAEKSMPPKKRYLFIALIIIMIPAALIAKQPDLGTALLVASSGFIVIFFAGIRWRLIFFAIVSLIPLAWVLWAFVMKEYQKQRVLTMFNPEQDALGSGYHIIQSKIAIGSGGLFGKGWLNGTQSHLDFIPEQSTDFVFAVIAEEFGLIGVILLLTVYFFIISRGLYIASQAQDTYSRLLAGSLTMTFLVYLTVNLGMVTGILPVVGVPLPLVSYGGTSVVTLMAAFGILMSIHTHRRMLST